MNGLDRRTGRGAEFVAEQDAQVLVRPERLGDVAALGEDLHEQPVAGLAVWRSCDELARRSLPNVQLAAPQSEGARCIALKRGAVNVVETAPMRFDPSAFLALQQAAPSHEQCHQRRAPGSRPSLLSDGGLGPMDCLIGRFEIDPSIGGKDQANVTTSNQRRHANPMA